MRTKLGKNNFFGQSDFDFNMTDLGFLIVEDLDLGNRSVTNDINNVISSLVQHGFDLRNLKVIYKDSSGIYDALLIEDDNTLLGIASLNAETQSKALKIYDTRIEHQCLKQHTAFNPC